MDQAKAERVRGALNLHFIEPGYYLSAEQLRMALGGSASANSGQEPLETVVVRAPPGENGSPLRSPIPLGFAGIVWGARHPQEAWRLILPIVD
jgi:hypothetical protein